MGRLLEELIVKYKVDKSELSTGLKEAKQEMQSLSSAASESSGGLLSGFKRAGMGVLDFGAKIGQTIFGLQSLAQGAIGFGEALIGPNASMEQTTVAFETLLGKGKKTSDFLNQLKQFAASTPFEFPELATDAQHMLAFGFTTQQVLPLLTNIGDAMGAMGKSNADIDHIVEVFGQMHAAGKLNAGDMMQLTSEGIPAWKFLADAMHMTVPEVQKLSSQGLIPADKAIQAVSDGMHKMFGGGMAAQANTFNGLMSTLQDNVSAALRAFTGPLFDDAKKALTKLGDLVSGKQFQDFATGAGKKVGEVINFLSEKASEALPSFQDMGNVLGQVGKFISDDLVPPAKEIFDVAGQIIENFIRWNDKSHFLQNTMRDVGDLLKLVADDVATKLMPPVRDAIDKFQIWLSKSGSVHDVFLLLGDAIDGVSSVVGGLVTGLSGVFDWFGQDKLRADLLKIAIAAIGGTIAGIKLVDFGKSVFSTFQKAQQDVKGFIDTVGKIGDKLGSVLDFFKNKFSPGASKALDDVSTSAEKTSVAEEGVGTSAMESETKVGAASALEESEISAVGADALVTSEEVGGIGTSATAASAVSKTAFGGIGAILGGLAGGLLAAVALAAGEFFLFKWIKDSGWIPDAPKTGPDWITHKNLGHADGLTNNPMGHMAWVGERGPERMWIPGGASVYSAEKSMRMGNESYPIRSSSGSSVAPYSSTSGGGSSGGGYGPQTIIVEIDSVEIARVMAPATDRLVRLKLAGRGRAA